jgi:hypothetical protein
MLHECILILFFCCQAFPLYVTAAELLLAWDFPRAYEPHPTSFVLTYATSTRTPGTLVEHAIPWHPVSACETIPDYGQDTFCARLACPGPGIYAFWLTAEWNTLVSGKTNLLTCQIARTDPACVCRDIDHVVQDLTAKIPIVTPHAPASIASLSSNPPLPIVPAHQPLQDLLPLGSPT